jgi:hypothetical protein
MYCVTLSQNLNIRVLIVYLHFSNASNHECMLPTNVLPSPFQRETLNVRAVILIVFVFIVNFDYSIQ